MQLYPHQEQALKETEKFNRVAYYLDMGLGKTFIGSQKMICGLGAYTNLVVCQKSKVQDWLEHFELYDKEWHRDNLIYDLTDKGDLKAFMNIYKDGGYSSRLIGVINYDLVFRRPELLELKNFTLLLDESSMIQNESTKRAKAILKMKPLNVILLSGTPTSGRYEKLWSQLRLLGWGISKKLFYQHYVDIEWLEDHSSGFKIPKVIGYKNVDRLKQKLAEHGAIFMKSDEVFDLPEQSIIRVNSAPAKEYKQFMKNDVVKVKKLEANVVGYKTGVECELIGDTLLTKRLYARQLCSQFSPFKLKAFEDLINSTDDRLIVFYNFNEELSLLLQIALKKTANISYVNGSRKDLQAYALYNDSITFVQYQAGAMGLNLQKANKVIYFSLTESSELFEQSKKRIHRIGQNQNCFYYIMICPGTVEEAILQALKERRDYTDELFKKYQEE